MSSQTASRPLQPEDWARAASYFVGVVWALTFFAIPPSAFTDGTELILRAVWLGITILGGGAAVAGALLGIDLKLELPGLAMMAIGPLLYMLSQVFLAASGLPGREALIVFALWNLSLLAPRAVGLNAAAIKAKRDKR